jgi:prepilin-type N-terminal cleavage/methylation domain-containing protein
MRLLRRHKTACRGGFSLIEVLIAVVVLSTGIVVVLQGLHASLSALDGAVDKTRAAMLLHAKLGEAQAAAFAGEDPSTLATSGSFQDPFDSYLWRLDVAAASLASGLSGGGVDSGELYEVDATVWREGGRRTYESSTLVYMNAASETSSGGGAP